MDASVALGSLHVMRVLAGLVLFLAPGAAWAWALFRPWGWLRAAPMAVLLSFTLVPFALLGLNLLFGMPLSFATGAYLSAVFALAGVAVALRPVWERAMAA